MDKECKCKKLKNGNEKKDSQRNRERVIEIKNLMLSLLLLTSSSAKTTSKLAGSTEVEVTAEEDDGKVEDAKGPEDAEGSPDA